MELSFLTAMLLVAYLADRGYKWGKTLSKGNIISIICAVTACLLLFEWVMVVPSLVALGGGLLLRQRSLIVWVVALLWIATVELTYSPGQQWWATVTKGRVSMFAVPEPAPMPTAVPDPLPEPDMEEFFN